jgi:hypothetical protein
LASVYHRQGPPLLTLVTPNVLGTLVNNSDINRWGLPQVLAGEGFSRVVFL